MFNVKLFVVNAEYNDFKASNGDMVHAQRVRCLINNSIIEMPCVTPDKFDFVAALKPQLEYEFIADVNYILVDKVSASGRAYRISYPTIKLFDLVGSDGFVTTD